MASIDPDVIDLIADERYKDQRHLSTREFESEPWEAIWLARVIWKADSDRAKLEKDRQTPTK